MRRIVYLIITIFIITFTNTYANTNLRLCEKNLKDIVSSLTLEQKVHLVVGTEGSSKGVSHYVPGSAGYTYAIDSLGIPSINLADGPVGVRITPVVKAHDYTSFATCFPSTTALAATWNSDIVRAEGVAIGAEAKSYGVDIMLTPGINIMRNPLCGRNFEYFSEDPLLSGVMGAAMINGIQQCGVGTSLKHFVANNQQTGKLYNDARISQRALREIYLRGFEKCILTSTPWTVMGSYNKIGGKYTQTNSELLRTILRDEWGYKGLVVTDWYKTRATIGQLTGGTNLLMPGEPQQVEEIIKAVKSGEISMANLDESVTQVLRLVMKSISYNGWKYSGAPDMKKHAALARDIAAESMVLLKNDSSVLPLHKSSKIALFGATAYKSIAGGTGSSNVNKPYITDIYKGLESAGFKINEKLKSIYLKYVDFENAVSERNVNSTDWENLSYNRTVIPEMSLARATSTIDREVKNSDIAVIVIGRGSGEEADRRVKNDFNLSDEEKHMIESVSTKFHAEGKKVVVVMNVCGIMEIASWRDYVDAILVAWFPGQECGDAIADVLSGKSDPSGRLPMTFPINYTDIPSSKNYPEVGVTKSGKNFDYTNYEEDIWVGYRYFNTANVPVAYPFGYGMSYSKFAYSNPKIVKKGNAYKAVVTVTNIGKQPSKEVVQLYISAPKYDMSKPESELKAFAKTKVLGLGESETVTMSFSEKDLASFNEAGSQWLMDKGEYKVKFGSSSTETKEKTTFKVSAPKTWKVNDVLRPVEPVNVLKISK